MTREEYEFMRGARATLNTTTVQNGQVVQLIGTSSSRIALVLFSGPSSYNVSTNQNMTAQFTVNQGDPPLELLVERLGDLVQQAFWVSSFGSGPFSVAWVETVLGQ